MFGNGTHSDDMAMAPLFCTLRLHEKLDEETNRVVARQGKLRESTAEVRGEVRGWNGSRDAGQGRRRTALR